MPGLLTSIDLRYQYKYLGPSRHTSRDSHDSNFNFPSHPPNSAAMEIKSTLETLAQSLTAREKARLHEVADLLLQVYHTLARMRYLEPEWIQPGPHDLDEHMALYSSLDLDRSTIYLYHILPYLDPATRDRLDFFGGGEFIDYRVPSDVEEGRDPTWSDDPAERLRPWMTPLSRSRNHSDVLVYDAKRHAVGIVDLVYGGSGDLNLREGVSYTTTCEGGVEKVRYWRTRDGENEECSVEEWEKQLAVWKLEAEERRREEDEEGEEEEKDANDWDEMDARPAPNVLRDIIRWYHELIELPGQGENDTLKGDKEVVKLLYHRHGWPGQDFDGEAFVVDRARAESAKSLR